MALTDTAIRNAKPQAKPYKLTDEKGLFLLVQPSGGKLWRFKFRVDGRDEDGQPKRIEKKVGFGTYPEVNLKDARRMRDEARATLAAGVDPAEKKRREAHTAKISAANSFEAVASAYIEKCKREGRSERTTEKQEWFVKLLDRTVGTRPVAEIQPFEMLEAVRKYESTGRTETAHRALQFASQVFRFAIANQLALSDPTRDLRGALTGHKSKHYAAILEPKKAGELLRAIDGYDGHPVTRFALQLAALVFVRPGELRYAEWSEFDFDAGVWRIPAEKMKARSEHVVPLSRQALGVLAEARALTGDGQYVFPSIRTHLRPMSENTVNAALRRLGYSNDEMTGHGFRAMASTLLNESGKWSPDAIERALAHKGKDAVRAAYHRGQHWQERVDMAQWWADYLDTLRTGAEVVPFPNAATR
ncbi:integrase arm-type DNA-binding domain-containing protein [Novosphingobium sp. ERN07]|uniref:tyrosine-type recombinase/integrase n=1 Tax=Novosphingobium sp. ERN07 TaxID=2726187 RepID=UPI0014576BBE|nr:integrase arm-type DNA-binding domain-containing protein [Novosphingobium sp. ERN07]NLR70770.1 integrase arm-type DNA-binding domain-containing protein [Novosphingobium sp. ERN07]